MNPSPTLEDVINSTVFNKDEILLELLHEAEKIQNALLYIANFSTRKFEFMSPTCLEKSKYSLDFFLKGGADALYHLAVPETKLTLVKQQTTYLIDLKQNYAPDAVKILEFPGILKKGNGEICKFLCLSLILTYTQDKDVDRSVILLMLNNVDREEDIEHCKGVLRKIKLRHNEVYSHNMPTSDGKHLTVIHISSKRTDVLLTKREEETLKYLAQGLTTKDISSAMSITENTVETYRKKLLDKFEAKNIAELIKKASKVYWLD